MAPLSTKHNPKTPQGKHRLDRIRKKACRDGALDPWKDKKCEYNICFSCTPNNCPQFKELREISRALRQHFKTCAKNKKLERSKLKTNLLSSGVPEIDYLKMGAYSEDTALLSQVQTELRLSSRKEALHFIFDSYRKNKGQ